MKQRIIFLDWLRVIACLMVMTVHACECIYSDDYTFSFPSEGAKYAVFIYQSLVRPTAVPLFLMASAFLLVPVKTDALQFFKKRFTRVLIPLLVHHHAGHLAMARQDESQGGTYISGNLVVYLHFLPIARVTGW